MDLIKILAACLFIGVCTTPVVTSASEADYNRYVEGALQVYKKFEQPSVDESQKFLSFMNKRWVGNNRSCLTNNCTIDGQSVGHEYAVLNRVRLENEVQ